MENRSDGGGEGGGEGSGEVEVVRTSEHLSFFAQVPKQHTQKHAVDWEKKILHRHTQIIPPSRPRVPMMVRDRHNWRSIRRTVQRESFFGPAGLIDGCAHVSGYIF